VNVSVAGPSSVCASCTGGTASESHTGGGPVTYQWGYRTVSAGETVRTAGGEVEAKLLHAEETTTS